MYKDCDSCRRGFESHHPIVSRMHQSGDETRSVVILRSVDYDEWLHAKDADAARLMLQLFPADEMAARPASK